MGSVMLSGSERSPIRLLYLAREIPHPAELSGAERRVKAFVDELAKLDVPLLGYFADRAQQRPGAPFAADRVRERIPPRARGLRRDVALRLEGRRWRRAHLAEIRRFRPTVVLERARYLDPSGAVLARRLGIPHVLELHGLLADDARSYYRSPLEPLGARFERRRHRSAARTIVVSEGLARWLVEAGAPRDRLVVIPNGVTPPPEPGAVDRRAAELRSAWGIEDRVVIGWIGHMMSAYVPSFLAFADLLDELDRDHPLALAVVGGGGAIGEIQAALEGTHFPVVVSGPATGFEADAHVRAFDIGVVPNRRFYDLPVKLFHYGGLEVPVLAPDTLSIRALAAERGLFFLFDPDSPTSIASALRSALAEPRERRARARALRRVVEEEHTWEAVVRRTLAVCMDASA